MFQYFYPIFKDNENGQTRDYNDKFPNLPFPNKPRIGSNREKEYKQRLLEVCMPSSAILTMLIDIVQIDQSLPGQ